MQDSLHLLRTRRFWPIFVTQFLGAFNDNLFRTSMVMLVIYGIYRDAEQEATFSAIAGGLFILRRLRAAIVTAVEQYVARLPRPDPAHPLLGPQRDRRVRFSGSWSVRLH